MPKLRTVHLKRVNFIKCKLFFSKPDFKNEIFMFITPIYGNCSYLSFLSECSYKKININIYQLTLMMIIYQSDRTLGDTLHDLSIFLYCLIFKMSLYYFFNKNKNVIALLLKAQNKGSKMINMIWKKRTQNGIEDLVETR